MRRALLTLSALATVLTLPLVAGAHPLGNFTINHHVGIHLNEDTLTVDYVLDMAEIPAFAVLRRLGTVTSQVSLDGYALEECAELAQGLTISLDGVGVEPAVVESRATTPPGQAGVPTLRVECRYRMAIRPGTLLVSNDNYSDRVGWREMVASSEGVAISTALPATSSSGRLTSYPEDPLAATPDVRAGRVVIGEGSVVAGAATPVAALGALVEVDSLGLGTGLAAIAAAVALGTAHALAPGHCKTIVAAYLVGTRGSARQAIVLALATAFSHTIGVAILGIVAATAAVTFEPAAIYPYLSALAGLVVLGIGVRLTWRLFRHQPHHHHDHDHTPPALGWKPVAALGLSGGLVPSASAVVLLLGAVHVGRVWFGVLLVAAFGVGMSMALVGSGLLAVMAQRLGWDLLRRRRPALRLGHWVPRLAATVVVVLGVVMTLSGVGGITVG